MPIQKTFTIVPAAISRDASPVPAFQGGRMTSKQVKEAYKTATKGPRMSRAERIKMEREEQQRIRKEMEKEKASAKARLLRDKKKEKELAEREVKRKAGRPLVNVRPSQDTIARFVRGKGTSLNRDCVESVVNRLQPPQAQPAKAEELPADGLNESKETLDEILENEGIDEEEAGPALASKVEATTNAENAISGPPSGLPENDTTIPRTALDPILGGDIPSDLLKEFESSFSQQPTPPRPEVARESPADDTLAAILDADLETDLSQDPSPVPRLPEPCCIANQLPQNELDQLNDLLDEDLELDSMDDLDGLKTTKERTAESSEADACAQEHPEPLIPEGGEEDVEVARAAHRPTTTKSQTGVPNADGHNMKRRSHLSANNKFKSSSPPTPQAPPMSTQAIMLNLDDFFPTSSQQARELDMEAENFDTLLDSLTPKQVMPPPPPPRSAGTPGRAVSRRSSRTPKAHTIVVEQQGHREDIAPPTRPTSSPSPRPQRWFTASGSRELESLAMQRSRRTAALEEIRQRERGSTGGWPEAMETREATKQPDTSPRKSEVCLEEPPSKRRCPSLSADKENIPPEASQETDYGGGWIEDFEF